MIYKKHLCLLFLFITFLSPILTAQSKLFWESPALFSAAQGNFPVTANNNNFGIVVWQEPVRSSASGQASLGSINISLAIKRPGEDWAMRGIIGGPYVYSGQEPSILSAAIDNKNRILIAAAASANQTEILISDDLGINFERYRFNSGGESSLAPRIAVCADGSYLLFITRGRDSSLSIYYSRSEDGRTWQPFQPFVNDSGMQLTFLPSHVSFGGREYVVFQSFTGSSEAISTFQLFIKISSDGGQSWSEARRFTQFRDNYTNTQASPDNFDNQRPQLSIQNNSLFLVWERRYRTSSPQVYAARLSSEGAIEGIAERINSTGAYCNNPIAFNYRGNTSILWFDNRSGRNHIFLAQRSGLNWEEIDLSGTTSGEASFGRPVIDRDGLYIFWQNTISQGNTRIYFILPDTTVSPVQIIARNFIPGQRTRSDRAQFSWNVPLDSSGIQGFSYAWSRNPNEQPPRSIQLYNTTGRAVSMEELVQEDGSWFFSIIAQDYAGNWSPPSRIEFIRDTTPPPAVSIIEPSLDERGYLLSNTFEIHWEAPPVPDVSGYAWNLEWLDESGSFSSLNNEQFAVVMEERYSTGNINTPRIQGRGTFTSYANQDNGVWRFTIRAIDEAGNVGPASSLFFRTNKYIPQTYVTFVDAAQDEQGILRIKITGRGFSQGGNVQRVMLDKDGIPPYDHEFFLDSSQFYVTSDREIDGIRADGIDEGIYRLGVVHPLRGTYFTGPTVSITETGTVKFGDYSNTWQPSWVRIIERRFSIDAVYLILISIFILCVLGIAISVRGIGETVAESSAIKLDAAALITGELMPEEKKKRLTKIKKRGIGLHVKLASFTIALVLAVVIMVSAPLYLIMTQTQQETLLRGLWDRSTVLLEGLATNARAYLPLRSVLELGQLPAQMNSVPEAQYVTITGYNPESTVFDDQVWASNDPDILDKINTIEFESGVSRITDVLSPRLQGISEELNQRAILEVGSISETINALTQEGTALAIRTDAESQRRLEDIQVQVRTLQARVSERLTEISKNIGSEPEFSLENFVISGDHRYIFFKPVMFRQGSEDMYFRGLVRLEISIDSILDEIADGRLNLIRVIMLVALAALATGTVVALIFATLIIRPIKQLVKHVEIIRDTEDKAKLDGMDIKLKSRDELAILGNTINEMTYGLVKAAVAASDLSIGKEIQKKFIPLELDNSGNKLSFGSKSSKYLDFFGYYEGAKGVSGDYFDYQDLDGRYYAIIKCDVAGKGIPAALIMIQIATMFLNYFKQWKPTEKGMHIEDVVYQINDFIETLGFKGRFAAFTLCLFDAETGLIRFCNAGDNIIHFFDSSEGKFKALSLPETPATGVLPNILIESKGGYSVQTMTLDHGDILLLYTDGIEEAKRKFRDASCKEIVCEEGEIDTPHETHTVGQADEELGPDRVEAIINSVMNKQVYSLKKWHNPEGDDKLLNFDFSDSQGSVEEVIMAMISVEKMFRCYLNPKAKEDDTVLVDKIVDAFLKKHFLQYRNYCSFTRETPNNPAYMYYTHVKEDEQYDDLTILGIKRK